MSNVISQYEAEYDSLRKEIENCINLSAQLSTFSMTAVAAVLAFAIPQNDPLLYMVPYVFIIPLSAKNFYYRKNIAKLSAYLIAVLEPRISGYNWETLNSEYKEKRELRLLFLFRNYEYFFEALICYLLFVASLLANSIQNPFFILDVIVGLSLLVYIFLVSYRANHTNALKESSVHMWKKISQDRNK